MTERFLICFCLFVTHFAMGQGRITNSIGMEFVLIESGAVVIGEFQPPYPVPNDTVKSLPHTYTMWMGDGRVYNEEEFKLAREMAMKDSQPGFSVMIEKPYYIATTEVTQGQWKKIMGYNPSVFQGTPGADSLPVENVSWKEAQKFIKNLNRSEKCKSYRLPTEFEWEYAARAGATKDIPWDEIQIAANLNKKTPINVASKKPNAWGLYDMLGNVWEWVDDYYNEKLFADPKPLRKGKQHVLKGASFVGDVKNATYMTHAGGPGNGWDVGFRIVKDVEIKSK
ncbi:formylglycine-generating enzyme family protein [Chryseolinea sp. H1M3-3]|uniref:formylglycine-generating enzyme family protein n=1 Tax=Chryseolinea sp. H1M3-3 TaxID=3034144 RepID=UPI0023EAFD86|nr:formylglycine-generating enzyme family protein [Chryseolinea sp. H1M3-3]